MTGVGWTQDPEPPTGPHLARSATVSGLGLLVLLSPILENLSAEPRDGFPLSYYPIFSKGTGKTTKIHHAVAVLRSGAVVNLPGSLVSRGGMNTQRRRIRKAVREGRADGLAKRIARQVAQRYADVVRVEVVESVYDIEGYFRDRTEPIRRTVVASQWVAR